MEIVGMLIFFGILWWAGTGIVVLVGRRLERGGKRH